MPVIELSKKDLYELIWKGKKAGKKLTDAKLIELLQTIKGDAMIDGDNITIEIADVNRPDMLSAEGIARELRARLGLEKGMPRYKLKREKNYVVNVSQELKEIRPVIACAIVKDVKLNDAAITQLIQLQEKLCEGFGRKRAEAAAGVYDFDKIVWPVNYITVKPRELKFVPLDMKEALTPAEILNKHEKGIQYKHLLEQFKEWPLLVDSAGNVLSMPPIINSAYSGKVTPATKNLFIEVTGMNLRFVEPVLNILATAAVERGGYLFVVEVKNPNIPQKKIFTPDLKPKKARLCTNYCNAILGTDFSAYQIASILGKARFNCSCKKDVINVEYAAYRQDIMDERDIIEDVAAVFGYSKLKPEMPEVATLGKAYNGRALHEKLREFLIGLGFQEVMTFTLTSKESLFKSMAASEREVIEVSNPISSSYACIRDTLLPSLLAFLSANTKKEFPQKIFEIGQAVQIINRKAKTITKLALAISSSDVTFTEAKQVLQYLFDSLGLQLVTKAKDKESLIEGRSAVITSKGKVELGIIGEVHPKVLKAHGLELPCVVAELDLEILKNYLE